MIKYIEYEEQKYLRKLKELKPEDSVQMTDVKIEETLYANSTKKQ